jgi:hypothetical protein
MSFLICNGNNCTKNDNTSHFRLLFCQGNSEYDKYFRFNMPSISCDNKIEIPKYEESYWKIKSIQNLGYIRTIKIR